MNRVLGGGAWILTVSLASVAATPAEDLPSLLAQVGRRVEAYYSRARSIVCTERVVVQALRFDYTPAGLARHLEYELRVEWDPPSAGLAAGEARIVRRLVSIGGRPAGPKDEPGCLDPKPVSPEPLEMFMPEQQPRYAFTIGALGREDGRPAYAIDYREAVARQPTITWKDECLTVDAPAVTRGRAWVDADTGDILRLDEWLAGLIEVPVPSRQQRSGAPQFVTFERADMSIQYRPVTFTDPDETVLLPSTIETFTIAREVSMSRVRTTQTFSDYRRFVTGGRVVQ